MREETASLVGGVGIITLAPGVAHETVTRFIKTKTTPFPQPASKEDTSTCWNNIIISPTKTSFICVYFVNNDHRINCWDQSVKLALRLLPGPDGHEDHVDHSRDLKTSLCCCSVLVMTAGS